MRRLAPALALLLLIGSPASAFVVEVTTSVAVADAGDQRALEAAVTRAVSDVLQDTITFEPTLVMLTHATLVGERLYIRLLIADSDGERTWEETPAPPDNVSPLEI